MLVTACRVAINMWINCSFPIFSFYYPKGYWFAHLGYLWLFIFMDNFLHFKAIFGSLRYLAYFENSFVGWDIILMAG